MRRVVVTGVGVISPIGCEPLSVSRALKSGQSYIKYQPDFAEIGMSSHVAGIPDLNGLIEPPRKIKRFMANAALYAWHAVQHALEDAALTDCKISHPRTGLIVGSGCGSVEQLMAMQNVLNHQGLNKVLPYAVPRVMGSSVSANLATALGIQGISYGLTSACATSAHCIGHAAELIQWGKQDIMLAGGAEEVSWHSAMLFDAMGALSVAGNTNPSKASKPYDHYRDGFVIAGGAGVLVLEELEHALARKASIYAEVVGYGAASDGDGMVYPSAPGAYRAMCLAMNEANLAIDYINTHATGTQQGDMVEVEAIKQIFGQEVPSFSSTKALTGHAIGASGALESIFCLLMIKEGFIAPSANIEIQDSGLEGLPLVTQCIDFPVASTLCNSLGFGGTNASLIYSTKKL
ncbi:MAG: beta-ketoacyl synthase N-terminal-like domain-containing protein [Pseudomonadota bacterium]